MRTPRPDAVDGIAEIDRLAPLPAFAEGNAQSSQARRGLAITEHDERSIRCDGGIVGAGGWIAERHAFGRKICSAAKARSIDVHGMVVTTHDEKQRAVGSKARGNQEGAGIDDRAKPLGFPPPRT